MKKLFFLVIFILCGPGLFSQPMSGCGTDFWVSFEPSDSDPHPILLISSEEGASGTITSIFNSFSTSFTVAAGSSMNIELPKYLIHGAGILDKGIHITSDHPVTIAGFNHSWLPLSTDAFLALPVESLGKNYFVLSYPMVDVYGPCTCGIVAPYNNTHISIFDKNTGLTSNITLNQGQTYLMTAEGNGADLTGSTIQSDQPVAVFSGTVMSDIPKGCVAADLLVEQMPPVESWGQEFYTVSFGGRETDEDYFRVLASQNFTQITLNGNVVATLSKGQTYNTYLTGMNLISSNAPVLVAQYAKGNECAGTNGRGDPMMMLVPPATQYSQEYRVGTIPGFLNYVNIIASTSALGTIKEDGIIIDPATFSQIGTSGYYGTRIFNTDSSHHYTGDAPFQVFSYGWNHAISYGYPAGGCISPINSVAMITLTPDTAHGILDETLMSFTATVMKSDGSPVKDIPVDFFIDGMGPLTGTLVSDDNGQAVYSYTRTGTTPGTDSIFAQVEDIRSNTSWGIWTTCTEPTAGGTIGSSQGSCENFIPEPVVSVQLPAGYQGELEYKWQKSTSGPSSGFTDIAGTNNPDYSPGLITQSTWFRRMATVTCSSGWTWQGISNVVEMEISDSLMPVINISVSANPYCEKNFVTATASGTNGGPDPVYQWMLNGTPAGTDSSAFAWLPADGDSLRCIMTSGLTCVIVNPVSSSTIIMHPDLSHPAGVSISATPNPYCQGTPVTLAANVTNGGNNPVVEWFINGTVTDFHDLQFDFPASNHDSVYCRLTSDLYCVSGSPVTSQGLELTGTFVEAGLSVFPTDTTISFALIILTDLSSGSTDCSIDWGDGTTTDCNTREHRYTAAGTYTIRQLVSNDEDCSDSAFASVIIRPEYNIYVPNAFTPNGDGINDTFRPSVRGVEKYVLMIYNRTGEELFSSNELLSGWDGKFKGHDCPSDSYTYKIEYLDPHTGERVVKKGYVVLVR